MNKKQITFAYPLVQEGITLEVNFEGTDNKIPFPDMIEPDSKEPYEAELKSVIFNSQNILPILKHFEATNLIQEEAVKVAWKEFNQ